MITAEKESKGTITIENMSRRHFLEGMLGASAFVLCVRTVPAFALTAGNGAPAANVSMTTPTVDTAAFHPGVYVGIQSDGTVLIVAHRTEMGNGVRTSLPRILADELDADWGRVTVIQGDGDEKYGSQDTDGSHSVREFFDPLREAGATARLMLIRAAARSGECRRQSAWRIPCTRSRTKRRTANWDMENWRCWRRSSRCRKKKT